MRGITSGVLHEWLETTPEYLFASISAIVCLRAITLMWSGSMIIFLSIMRRTVYSPRSVRPFVLQCGFAG